MDKNYNSFKEAILSDFGEWLAYNYPIIVTQYIDNFLKINAAKIDIYRVNLRCYDVMFRIKKNGKSNLELLSIIEGVDSIKIREIRFNSNCSIYIKNRNWEY